MTRDLSRASVAERIDALEEAYEFMLAYAAQGALDDPPTDGRSIRSFLDQIVAALDGLAAGAGAEAERLPPALAAAAAAFVAVLNDDAGKAIRVVRVVQACPRVSSQIIDNLNASIHLRAVLTDLFLLDEVLGKKGGVHVDEA
jgi:hypothetical protein